MTRTSTLTGCGHDACECSSQRPLKERPVASVNGIALHEPCERPGLAQLRERAGAELLRQHAVAAGLLPAVAVDDTEVAPVLTPQERQVIEAMIDREVTVTPPTEQECRRYYDSHHSRFVVGLALHVRHILFAVTPGVNVHALTMRAEQALLELSRKDVPEGRFAELTAELSNCPTGAYGGDLGWIGPEDCAPELANELFHQKDAGWGMGLHPRLVHTRFGFHIIEVLGRRRGQLASFAEVRGRIEAELTARARIGAIQQYMGRLTEQADVEGVSLEDGEQAAMA